MSREGARPWLAALLAFLYPGLGHVYLRRWLRALSWFLLALATASVVMPESVMVAFEQRGFEGLLEASRSLPLSTLLPLFGVRLLNVIDAYLSARRASRKPESGPRCPECGKPLDEDLAFCPWCTTRLEESADGNDATSR